MLRVKKPNNFAPPENAGNPESTHNSTDYEGDKYLARLMKLVPGEAVTAYGLASGRLSHRPALDKTGAVIDGVEVLKNPKMLYALAFGCIALSGVARWHLTKDKLDKKPQKTAVIISMISCMLWIASQKGTYKLDMFQSSIAQDVTVLTTTLWIFATPYFFKGDTNM